jgi:catechol 2,3-dioxygenase-like lactoylglutathione lyase family enzyme
MITKMSHMTIYVLNQQSARDFYTNKLGFKVVTDVPMNKESSWLTVAPPGQPDLEIVLFPVTTGRSMPKETADAFVELIKKGGFGYGVFECTDIYATYEELLAKGVEFIKPPTQEFYGTEAFFKDDSGNWFSLQAKNNKPGQQ